MTFDELAFLREVRAKPGMYFGKKSLLGLRDLLSAMELGADAALADTGLPKKTLFPIWWNGFVPWYTERYVNDRNGYAAWWNHLLYVSGNSDDKAFDNCFRCFDEFLRTAREAGGLNEAQNENR